MIRHGEVVGALNNVFGPTNNFAATGLAAATQTLVSSVPSVVYGLSVIATATIATTLGLVNSTATANGEAMTWGTAVVPVNGISRTFARPLRFDKGIVLTYTATGAATVSLNLEWSPFQF